MVKLETPGLAHVCDLHLKVARPLDLGEGRAGQRRIIPVIGGEMRGPRLNGRLLEVGADWQTIFADGVAEIGARHVLETNDGAVIDFANSGFRHGPPEAMAALGRGEDVAPDAYYMRTTARLETGDERYAWVNRTVFVGTGAKLPEGLVISLFAVE